MAKYLVNFVATAGFTATVEADSEEEAEEFAYEEIPGLCWACAKIDLGDFQLAEDDEFMGKSYPAIELVEE